MNVDLHFQTYGEGEPVVILHGLFGSGRNWTGLAKKLSGNYQVISVDLRNHGQSVHADSMNYSEMAGDIASLLESLKLDRVNIIGHSMGGKVAMTFALQYRAIMDKLVVLDIAPVAYQNEFNLLIDAMMRLSTQEIQSRGDADELLGKDIPDDSLRRFLLQNLMQDGESYRWRVNLDAIRRNLIEISGFPAPVTVNSQDCKTLFLTGADSDYVQSHHHPIIRKYFSNANIQTIDEAGHWLHVQQPDKVLQRITTFLAEEGSEDPPSLLYGR